MNTNPPGWTDVVDFVLAHTVVVQGTPLPPWAARFVGVIIPPSFRREPSEPPEFTLAAYLWGRGTV